MASRRVKGRAIGPTPPTDPSGPEIELWRAVIRQQITDATTELATTHISTVKHTRDTARAWLLGNSEDFRTVCHLAGLEPAAVRDAAERLQGQGWPGRLTERRRASSQAAHHELSAQ